MNEVLMLCYLVFCKQLFSGTYLFALFSFFRTPYCSYSLSTATIEYSPMCVFMCMCLCVCERVCLTR